MQHVQRADAKKRMSGGQVQKGQRGLRKLRQGGPDRRELTREHERGLQGSGGATQWV